MHKLGPRLEEKSPRQPFLFVLAPQIPLLDEGPGCKDRSFSGAVGGAATEPRSGAGTAFLRRAPLGSNPGAGCCTARVPASGASTGRDGKTIGRVGERIPPRGVPGGATFKFARRSSGAPLPPRNEEDRNRFFDNLGLKSRGTTTRVRPPASR